MKQSLTMPIWSGDFRADYEHFDIRISQGQLTLSRSLISAADLLYSLIMNFPSSSL